MGAREEARNPFRKAGDVNMNLSGQGKGRYMQEQDFKIAEMVRGENSQKALSPL